jgi:hypothetical protein
MIPNPQQPNASRHPGTSFQTLDTQPPKNGNEEANTSTPQTNLGTGIRAKLEYSLGYILGYRLRKCAGFHPYHESVGTLVRSLLPKEITSYIPESTLQQTE